MCKSLAIQIICPSQSGTQHGNRITALRWRSILRELGHRPAVIDAWNGRDCDVLLAMHASKSARSIATFRQAHPRRRLIVALTGTDLYRDFETKAAQHSVECADQLVVLQTEALRELSPSARRKANVIYQSVQPLQITRPMAPRQRRVVVAGHLRGLKDPFRAAKAVRKLPTESRIVIHHYGAAREARLKVTAETEMARNQRYHWFGERPRSVVRQAIARCWLLVHPSRMEGGANVVSEAIANQIPILASRIPGSVGLLGQNYAGYFTAGDTQELRQLLQRCETVPRFYRQLNQQVARRTPLFTRDIEREAWRKLISG